MRRKAARSGASLKGKGYVSLKHVNVDKCSALMDKRYGFANRMEVEIGALSMVSRGDIYSMDDRARIRSLDSTMKPNSRRMRYDRTTTSLVSLKRMMLYAIR